MAKILVIGEQHSDMVSAQCVSRESSRTTGSTYSLFQMLYSFSLPYFPTIYFPNGKETHLRRQRQQPRPAHRVRPARLGLFAEDQLRQPGIVRAPRVRDHVLEERQDKLAVPFETQFLVRVARLLVRFHGVPEIGADGRLLLRAARQVLLGQGLPVQLHREQQGSRECSCCACGGREERQQQESRECCAGTGRETATGVAGVLREFVAAGLVLKRWLSAARI